MNVPDPVELTARLVQCRSVTPSEGGALQLLEGILAGCGFECTRVDRGGVPNLFARWGTSGPIFGYNGHTDVVPTGDPNDWSVDPFGGSISHGRLWGRGAVDMKSSVAAFVSAATGFIHDTPPAGSIIITITGDEEAIATDGTIAILDWMEERNHQMDVCLVGEPSCPEVLGEAIKVGRRGSLSAIIELHGRQGHSAYPEQYINPLSAMSELAHLIASHRLDEGAAEFQPSNIAITSIDTNNKATNVVPARCSCILNIRFNNLHSSTSLMDWLHDEMVKVMEKHGVDGTLKKITSSESFLTGYGPFTELVSDAVRGVTGITPALSTGGGTSDARFFCNHCPVIEFGLVGKTLHQVDENTPVEDIISLRTIYRRCLEKYFA